MEYLLLGEIQETIVQHYRTYRQGLGFRDAVMKLRSQNRTYHGTPDYPDFLSWDIHNPDALKSLVAQIPVPLEEFSAIHRYDQPSVMINLEFHTPDTFKSLPHVTILYVLSGFARFFTHTDSYPLEPGSLLILSPELPHRLVSTYDDVVLSIISAPDLFEKHFSQILEKNKLLSTFFYETLRHRKKDFLRFKLPPSQEVLNLIKYLFAEFISIEPFSTEVFLNYLQILYAHILRNCNTDDKYTNFSHHSQITIFPSILLYIQKHFKTTSLSELAEHFSYAPSYLSRLIKQETGNNFNEIITDMKIKEAKQLLLFTPYSIGKIAMDAGYNSADHFTHSFRKATGYTPSEFRKKAIPLHEKSAPSFTFKEPRYPDA